MLIDSSVLVAYFNTADIHHGEARMIMDHLQEWLILELILFETITVLQIKAGKTASKEALRYLLEDRKIRVVPVEQEDLFMASEQYQDQKGSLTLYDWVLYATSKRTHIPFKSFDRKLNRLVRDKNGL